MLIELADVSRAASRERRDRQTPPSTSRWQSSNVPADRHRGDVAAKRRELRFLNRRDAALGKQDDDARAGDAENACATALPVSPDVATSTVSGASLGVEMRHQPRHDARADVLEGEVGP